MHHRILQMGHKKPEKEMEMQMTFSCDGRKHFNYPCNRHPRQRDRGAETGIQRDKDTQRQTERDKKRDTHRDRETEAETKTQKEREREILVL